jgi:hypothetical protein
MSRRPMTRQEFRQNAWLYEKRTDEEVAELLGLSRATVKKWRRPRAHGSSEVEEVDKDRRVSRRRSVLSLNGSPSGGSTSRRNTAGSAARTRQIRQVAAPGQGTASLPRVVVLEPRVRIRIGFIASAAGLEPIEVWLGLIHALSRETVEDPGSPNDGPLSGPRR